MTFFLISGMVLGLQPAQSSLGHGYICNFSYIYPYFTYLLDGCVRLCYFAFISVFDYMADFILDAQISCTQNQYTALYFLLY